MSQGLFGSLGAQVSVREGLVEEDTALSTYFNAYYADTSAGVTPSRP